MSRQNKPGSGLNGHGVKLNDHTFKVLTIRMTLWSEFSKEEYNNLSPGISLTMQTFFLLLIAN